MTARRISYPDHNDWDGTGTPTENELWRGAEINDTKATIDDHAERIDEQKPFSLNFGDGFLVTHNIAHTKENVSNAYVVDNSSNKVIGVGVDWFSVPGQVVVGPFATAPAVNQMKIVVEGYKT